MGALSPHVRGLLGLVDLEEAGFTVSHTKTLMKVKSRYVLKTFSLREKERHYVAGLSQETCSENGCEMELLCYNNKKCPTDNCNDDETIEHLLFDCQRSQYV